MSDDDESAELTFHGVVAASHCDCCCRRLKRAFAVCVDGETLHCGPVCAAQLLGCSAKDLRAVARLSKIRRD